MNLLLKSSLGLNASLFGAVLLTSFLLAGSALADSHALGVPQFSSDPGAPFTLYLDVSSFNYSGAWSSNELMQPGSTPAYDNVPAGSAFSPGDIQQIDIMYATVAQNYAGFNINVTTVDPAVAAGQSATDALRQAYYDATPNLMQMATPRWTRRGRVSTRLPCTTWARFS